MENGAYWDEAEVVAQAEGILRDCSQVSRDEGPLILKRSFGEKISSRFSNGVRISLVLGLIGLAGVYQMIDSFMKPSPPVGRTDVVTTWLPTATSYPVAVPLPGPES